MLRVKRTKKLINSLGLCVVATIPLVLGSCSNEVTEPYYSDFKTQNGYSGIRKHYPRGGDGEKVLENNTRLWSRENVTFSFIGIGVYKLIDDNFKTLNNELFNRLDEINKEYRKKDRFTPDELDKLSQESDLITDKIVANWLENHPNIWKDRIFTLINNLDDFPEDYKEIKNKFKNVDFNKQTILIINGLDTYHYSSGGHAKDSGYWIDNIEITNKKMIIKYIYKYIPVRSNSSIETTNTSISRTTHFVVVDKLTSLDDKKIEIIDLSISNNV